MLRGGILSPEYGSQLFYGSGTYSPVSVANKRGRPNPGPVRVTLGLAWPSDVNMRGYYGSTDSKGHGNHYINQLHQDFFSIFEIQTLWALPRAVTSESAI